MLFTCHLATVLDINECASMPCLNGAPCSDRVNGYSCQCASGYTGTNCQTGEYIGGVLV